MQRSTRPWFITYNKHDDPAVGIQSIPTTEAPYKNNWTISRKLYVKKLHICQYSVATKSSWMKNTSDYVYAIAYFFLF